MISDFEKIATYVCDGNFISKQQLIGTSRKQNLCEAREMFSKFAKVFCNASCVAIARFLNRHYTTVINSLQRYGDDYSCSSRFRQRADAIANNLFKYYATQKHRDS